MKATTKRYIILLIMGMFCLMPTFSQATLRICCYYNGFWGDWSNYWTCCWGGYDGFILYPSGEHKSNYHFGFHIDGYTTPTKKEIKEHKKNNTWWTYTGTVEYYISDVYPTFKSCLMELGRPLEEEDTKKYDYIYKKLPLARATNMRKYGEVVGFTRVSSKATIKIEPYKVSPEVYNIFVDGVGFAISMNGNKFSKK